MYGIGQGSYPEMLAPLTAQEEVNGVATNRLHNILYKTFYRNN